MNRLRLLAFLALAGCATHPAPHHTAPREAPSLAGIGSSVTSAQGHSANIAKNSATIGQHAVVLKSNASRIDSKAEVITRWLQ